MNKRTGGKTKVEAVDGIVSATESPARYWETEFDTSPFKILGQGDGEDYKDGKKAITRLLEQK